MAEERAHVVDLEMDPKRSKKRLKHEEEEERKVEVDSRLRKN